MFFKRAKLRTYLAAVLTLSLFFVGGAFADDAVPSSTLVVSPPNQQIILMPGETYEGSIMVSNPNDSAYNLEYSVSIGSFAQYKTDDSKDDYGGASEDIVTSYNQMMDWIVLDKTSGIVVPNGTDTIPFKIMVPEDAPSGGQYATIIVRDETDIFGNSEGNVSIRNIAQLASIIYAEVTGETREEGVIKDNIVPTFVLNSDSFETPSMVYNGGNVHTNAKYTLQVWPLFSDEEICTNEEEPDTSLVLPDTNRYHVQTCNLPIFGIFRAKQTVTIFGETSIVEKMIIVCPIWLLFIILFVVLMAIFWLFTRSKARKGSKKVKTAE